MTIETPEQRAAQRARFARVKELHKSLHSDAELGDRSSMDRKVRAGCLNLAHLQYGTATADIGHDRQPAKICDSLAQKFETFARSIGLLDRRASNVVGLDAPGSRQRPTPTGSICAANTIGMRTVAYALERLYFPPPVRRVEIPKRDGGGGVRPLGIPTVADRVAQEVARRFLEPILDPVFHPDSYGYRPGKSAIDAVRAARER